MPDEDSSSGEERTPEQPDEAILKRRKLASQLAREARSGGPDTKPKSDLGPATVRDYEQDVELKKTYARTLLCIMVGQLVIADIGFFLYATFGVNWKVDTSVIQAWLAATVFEVIGIALVVTRYLFPRRDQP